MPEKRLAKCRQAYEETQKPDVPCLWDTYQGDFMNAAACRCGCPKCRTNPEPDEDGYGAFV